VPWLALAGMAPDGTFLCFRVYAPYAQVPAAVPPAEQAACSLARTTLPAESRHPRR
jgi:hypothetical protein